MDQGKNLEVRDICFDKVVSTFGFIKNTYESCVHKKVSGSNIVFLGLYVDDKLLIGNNIPGLHIRKGLAWEVFINGLR